MHPLRKLRESGKPTSAATQAYDDFEHGRLVGRAVLMPSASEAADNGTIASSRLAATTA